VIVVYELTTKARILIEVSRSVSCKVSFAHWTPGELQLKCPGVLAFWAAVRLEIAPTVTDRGHPAPSRGWEYSTN